MRWILWAMLVLGCGSAPRGVGEIGAVPPEEEVWRVVSYNIHHGAGMDERVDLERIATVLRALEPDLIALQEVDEGVERSGGEDQAARLGELLGMQHAFGSFMDYQGGRYGLAILSRRPIRATRSLRLTDGNEPRVALAVEVERPGGGVLTFVDVHFDWVGDDTFRFAQAQDVARFLDSRVGPYIIAGDFNDVPGSRTLSLFSRRASEASKPPGDRLTFPSTAPTREIDFVFFAPGEEWAVREVRLVDEPMASDHRPVLAVLEYRGGAAGSGEVSGIPR